LSEHSTKDSIIAGYYPLSDELDVRPILEHLHGLGNKVALPVVRKDGAKTWMEFREWTPGQELQECVLGKKILEPQESDLV
jgi:5-formyltetrahydrofolate cyclo-ligase